MEEDFSPEEDWNVREQEMEMEAEIERKLVKELEDLNGHRL